jgi:hypothetical protein
MSTSDSEYYHVSHEEIAAFVDGSLGEIDEARIRVHLDCCDRCMDNYRYAARFTGMSAGVIPIDSPGKEAVRAAKAVVERRYRRGRRGSRAGGRWLAGLSPVARTLAAAVVVAVFVAVVVWLRPGAGGGFDPWSDSMSPVTDALVNASERNPLVFPGVETEISSAPAVVRSGAAPLTPSLDETLSGLAADYNEDKVSVEEARWLAGGYLATGQLDNARVYLEDALTRFPADRDIRVLAGMLAWSANDLGRATDLLESVVEEEPDHTTAVFNLAIVKKETGDRETARDLFEKVRLLAPGSPLAVRADTELKELSR